MATEKTKKCFRCGKVTSGYLCLGCKNTSSARGCVSRSRNYREKRKLENG